MFVLLALDAKINRVLAFFATLFAIFLVFSPIISGFFLVAAGLVEFLGFGGRRNGALQQRRHGLKVGHCFGYNVLRKSVGNNRGRGGWNLHALCSLLEGEWPIIA